MALFFQNFGKAGSGIARNDPNRKGAKLLFDLYSTHLWKLMLLNLIYTLFCIPIITIAPATAALVKLLKNYSIEKHVDVWSDFRFAFKQNFKKSFLWGLLNLVSFGLMIIGIYGYSTVLRSEDLLSQYQLPPAFFKVLIVLTISFAIFMIMINFYFFLMLVSTELKFKDILKNSITLVFVAPKQNLLSVLFFAGMPLFFGYIRSLVIPGIQEKHLVLYYTIIDMIVLFFLMTFIWLIVCINCYPVVQKYVINPYYEARGERNPELFPEFSEEDEDVIFKDMGGFEAPTDLNGGGNSGNGSKRDKSASVPKGKVIK